MLTNENDFQTIFLRFNVFRWIFCDKNTATLTTDVWFWNVSFIFLFWTIFSKIAVAKRTNALRNEMLRKKRRTQQEDTKLWDKTRILSETFSTFETYFVSTNLYDKFRSCPENDWFSKRKFSRWFHFCLLKHRVFNGSHLPFLHLSNTIDSNTCIGPIDRPVVIVSNFTKI